MTLPKTILIGGIATVVIATGIAIYLSNSPEQSSLLDDSLLKNYQELLEEIEDPKTKANLLSSCGSSKDFANQIQALENKLSDLHKRKIDNLMQRSEYQPKPFGACARDYNGEVARPGSWMPGDLGGKDIPPGSWPLDLDTGKPIPPPGWPLDFDGNPIPPGECPRDYDGKPMVPGSWELDLDGNSIPPGSWPLDFDTGKPIPPPGWPLDFDGNPIPPGSPEIPTDFMPENFELYEVQPSDSKENVDATPLQKMIELEVKISSALDGLKSLCDEKPKEKEIISTSCEEACKKYAKCASYAEGATKEDEKDAYDSCMFDTPDVDGAFACPRWSDEAKICVNKKQINTPADCVNFSTICLSKEMQEGRDEVYTEMEKYR